MEGFTGIILCYLTGCGVVWNAELLWAYFHRETPTEGADTEPAEARHGTSPASTSAEQE